MGQRLAAWAAAAGAFALAAAAACVPAFAQTMAPRGGGLTCASEKLPNESDTAWRRRVPEWERTTPCLESRVRKSIEVDLGDDLFLNGNGFFVGDGVHAVTSAHVVGGCRFFSLLPIDAPETRATLVYWDARRDVAILRADTPTYGGLYLTYVDANQPVGPVRVPVFNYGLNADRYPQVYNRSASAPNEVAIGATGMMVVSGQFEVGASGAPLLDAQGFVVGMMTAEVDHEGGRVAVATPSDQIAEALRSAGVDSYVAPANLDPSAVQNAYLQHMVRVRCR